MCWTKPPEILTVLVLFIQKKKNLKIMSLVYDITNKKNYIYIIIWIPRPIHFTPPYSSALVMSYSSILCRGILVYIVSMYACLGGKVDYIPVYIYSSLHTTDTR